MSDLFHIKETVDGFRGEYGFLSNMYPTPVQFNHIVFPCSETLYHYLKTDSEAWRTQLLMTDDGYAAKRVAQRSGFPRCSATRRLDAMRTALECKFSNPELAQKLEDTKGIKLVEYNHWKDQFWGVFDGKGDNHLGRMLMEIRERIITDGHVWGQKDV